MRRILCAALGAFALPTALTAEPAPPAPPPPAEGAPGPERGADPRRGWLERFNQELQRRRDAEPGAEEGEEQRADPIKTLEEAAKLMAEAEDHLNAAAVGRAGGLGAEAEQKLAPPPGNPQNQGGGGQGPDSAPGQGRGGEGPGGGAVPQAQEKQAQARGKLDKLLGDADKKQKGTIDLINVLIRQARQAQGSSKPSSQPQQQRQSMQPQNSRPSPNASNPAPRPYDPPPSSATPPPPRTADRTDRWGDLPPHIRDDANTGKLQVEEFPAEYRDLLRDYYKRLSGEAEAP